MMDSVYYFSDLEEAANPVNKHMQASWNMIVDDNDSLTKENKMLIAQQKVLENTQNQKIRLVLFEVWSSGYLCNTIL